MKTKTTSRTLLAAPRGYDGLIKGIAQAIQTGRRQAAWNLNAIMTAVYWEIGRRVVEFEQHGAHKAEYGERVILLLSKDLTARFGRGFRQSNLYQIRAFYLAYPHIFQTPSGKSDPAFAKKFQTVSGKLAAAKGGLSPVGKTTGAQLTTLTAAFMLPWSHYARLLTLKNLLARGFYEEEAIRGGWSVRQLDRQIATQLYERTAFSRDKAAMLKRGARPQPEDRLTPEEEIKDAYVLEFLNLKDEYSESDLEEALIRHLEQFLIELGGDFAFVGRQRRLRVGGEWYRLDLLFFHRRLRCLVIIDLKVGKFTHADAGQMHLYLNYAREHWTHPDENPPVGLILCAEKDAAVAKYALDGLPNKIMAAEYKLALPDEKVLIKELRRTQRMLAARRKPGAK